MKIIKELTESNWIVTVKFGSFRFTDGHGPFFMVGDFNNWKVEDEKFKIKQPPHRGANSLLDFRFEFPISLKSFEFKIWDSYNYASNANWIEPKFENGYGSIYENYNSVVNNPYGTLNIKVNQINT